MRSSNQRGSAALLIVLLILVVAAVYWFASPSTRVTSNPPPVGTSGTAQQADERVREKGREIGEKVAVGTERLKEHVDEAALTAKIKAKMTLDDTVKARGIDVDTNGTVVTLTGKVRSAAERDRAVSLARETAGVTRVVDHLTLQ